MAEAATMGWIVGLAYAAVHGPLVAAPAWSRRMLTAFPRNVWAGRILAAIAMAWSARLLRDLGLGWFDPYKDWVYVAGPVTYFLIILFMDELLSARALGGLFLLMAEPVLESVRLCESQWRLLPLLLAYGWVLIGVVLMLSPYRFRKTMSVLCASDAGCRWFGVSGLILGLVLIALAMTSFAA